MNYLLLFIIIYYYSYVNNSVKQLLFLLKNCDLLKTDPGTIIKVNNRVIINGMFKIQCLRF